MQRQSIQQPDLRQDTQSPKVYFEIASAEHKAGNVDKATRFLRMALNTYQTELLNQYDIKSTGDNNNA